MNNKISFKLYTFLVCILTYSSIYSQTENNNCQFALDVQSVYCDDLFSPSTDPDVLDAFDPVVFNIYFWEIRRSNGTIDSEDEQMDFEKEALDVIAALNIFYNPYNVFFKYYGIDTIDDSFLYDLPNGILSYINNYPNPSEVIVPNSFNFYISAEINYGAANPFKPKVVSGRWKFKNQVNNSIHEVGHGLGLFHTFENWHGDLTNEDCERVTRDTDNSDYNANVAGDRVTDTAATSPLYSIDLGYTDEVDEEYCIYIGNGTDCSLEAVPYVITPDDVHNIMGYTYDSCADRITIGQAIRLRQSIVIDCEGELNAAIRTDGLASFYEPYKGGYSVSGEISPPLFQPGFDYAFLSCECDCPLPLDYGDTNFTYNSNEQMGTFVSKYETDYSSITHPNYKAIDILQLDEPQPWRCYGNDNLRPKGGTIIKFNDNVFNTNVTITVQDSLSINNENLIDELEPGLYNIIEQYENGDTKETLILKENN